MSSTLTLPAGVTLNGNGKQINGTIYAGGDLTFAGHTKVTAFSATYYNRTITIGEGACLEVTGTGRVTFSYGNTFNITGTIQNAKDININNISPSLIVPAGFSFNGAASDATVNVKNAYIKVGPSSSKPAGADGIFNFNFDNSIVEFTKELAFYESTGGVNPCFKVTLKDSKLTTGAKFQIWQTGSKLVVDNSIINVGYFLNRGNVTVKNKSIFEGSTSQYGESGGGNDGSITVDNSTLTVKADSPAHAFDGKGIGSISATNGATVNVDYYKAMSISTDATSTFTGTEVQ